MGTGRFEFGRNWQAFLSTLDEERIREAEASLGAMLERSLAGRRFLDAGCGSGLFSLAARRLGATVHSFDLDPESVSCARELKERFFPGDGAWTVEEGSVLDGPYLLSLGTFDVVYSWGVLHHTGDLWRALRQIVLPVAPEGQLFVALYNDQGFRSRLWRTVKRTYCSGKAGRLAVNALFVPALAARSLAAGVLRHGHPLGHMRSYKRRRGMSLTHDWADWLGGYPFETARPGDVSAFLAREGFETTKVVLTRSHGCNEFVLHRRGKKEEA